MDLVVKRVLLFALSQDSCFSEIAFSFFFLERETLPNLKQYITVQA